MVLNHSVTKYILREHSKFKLVHSDLPSVESFDKYFATKVNNIIDILYIEGIHMYLWFTKIDFNDSLFHLILRLLI